MTSNTFTPTTFEARNIEFAFMEKVYYPERERREGESKKERGESTKERGVIKKEREGESG